MGDKFLDMLLVKAAESHAARCRFERLHAKASAAKKAWEAYRDEIDAMLARRREELGPDRLPFPPDEEDDDDSDDDDGSTPAPTPVPPDGAGEVIDAEYTPGLPALPGPSLVGVSHEDAWKYRELGSLGPFGMSPQSALLLLKAGLVTVGDLANWSNSGKQLTDIDGIGEAKAGEIEETLDMFWIDQARQHVVRPEPMAEPKKRRKKVTDE